MSLTSLTMQHQLQEATAANYHYDTARDYAIDGGWNVSWVSSWSEAASASATWATAIKYLAFVATPTVTISDASSLDGTSATEYVVVFKMDEWSFRGTSDSTVVRGMYKFYKSNGSTYKYAAVAGKLRTWGDTDLTRSSGGNYSTTAWWDFAVLNDVCVGVNGSD